MMQKIEVRRRNIVRYLGSTSMDEVRAGGEMCACTHDTQYRAWSLSDHTGLSPSAFFVGNTSVATSSRGGYPAFVDRPSAMA